MRPGANLNTAIDRARLRLIGGLLIYDRYNIYSRKGEHIGEVGQYSPQDAAKFAAFAYQRERSDLVVVRTADDKGVEQTRAAILDAESRMSH